MATYDVILDGKVVQTFEARNYQGKDDSFWFFDENAGTVGRIAKAPGMSVAKRDSGLRPWAHTVRGATGRAGHSREALRRLQNDVKFQRQRLVAFAREHPRQLTMVEFREYKLHHGAWLDASNALWQFEHPGVPSPEFKLTRP